MDIKAVVVAVIFGTLMGWGLAGRHDDRRPPIIAVVVGFVVGATVLVADLGADPSFVGGSLLLGCAAALAAMASHPARRGDV